MTHQLNRIQQSNIDFLRAMAVLAVFIHHAQHVFGGSFPFFGDYGGQFGPQLFFLISGYLIAASYARYNIKQYAIHRCFRIFPAYWVYFLAFGLYSGVLAASRVSGHLPGLFSNLFLLQQSFPETLLYYDVLHVTWTLTVELFWYAFLPLILLVFKKIDAKLVVGSIVIATGFNLLSLYGTLDFIYPVTIAKNVNYRYLFLSNHFIVQLPYFLLGAYIFYNNENLSKSNALGYVVAGLSVFLLKPYYFIFNPIIITGFGLAFFLVAAISAKSINTRGSAHLSNISYSVYLCHFPILLLVKAESGLNLDGVAGVICAAALTLIASTVSYQLVEKPGIKIGKRLADRFRATHESNRPADPRVSDATM